MSISKQDIQAKKKTQTQIRTKAKRQSKQKTESKKNPVIQKPTVEKKAINKLETQRNNKSPQEWRTKTKKEVFAEKQSFSLSKEGQEVIKKEMTRYETKLSCLIPCLWQIQKEKGWISKEAISWLSEFTEIPESHIFEVFMFYTMFNKKPVGKFHIQVCANVSCTLKGARELVKGLCKDFDIKEGERSVCGNWTVSKVECLGACDEAPVIQLNNDYIGNIKKDDLILLLKSKIN